MTYKHLANIVEIMIATNAQLNKLTSKNPRCLPLVLGFSIIILPLLSNLSANAQTKSTITELKISSGHQNKQSCPNKIRIVETPQPYREGSFATDGYANLNSIASNVTVAKSYKSSVTWVGKLKPKYAKCSGSTDKGQFKTTFAKGKIYFTLNVGNQLDPNKQALQVVKKSVNNGNPKWTWAGSD
jgi:hypothetical protein